MPCNLIKFLDNSTIAGLIILLIGSFAGVNAYKNQKTIDRKHIAIDKIGEALQILLQHCRSINQSIDRMVNTYVSATKEEKEKMLQEKDYFNSDIKILADFLMYKIPEDLGKIESILSLYFEEEGIKKELTEFTEELKKWHDFTQNYMTNRGGLTFDPSKRVKDVKELSLNCLESAIKELQKMLFNQRNNL